MSNDKTIICLRADQAERRIAAFREFAGADTPVVDRGALLGGTRRFEVDTNAWSAYTKAVSREPVQRGRLRLFRCGDCTVKSAAPGLAAHQRSTGHEGKEEVYP